MAQHDAKLKPSCCRRIRIWSITRGRHETKPPRIFGIIIALFYSVTLLLFATWLLIPTSADSQSCDSSAAFYHKLGSVLGALPDLSRFRDIFLLLGAAVAVPAVVWRTHIAQSQAFTAHFERLNTTFREGITMLGHQNTSVQMRGVYEMLRVMEEHPDMFHVGMMRHFCALLRDKNSYGPEPQGDLSADSPLSTAALAALEIIASRSARQLLFEQAANYAPDLSKVSFSGLELDKANLSNCVLREAIFCGAQLAGADFTNSDISGADFSRGGEMPAAGLTQSQLELAYADPNCPPLLDGVKSEETGEKLVWKN